jgi:hypothetical protein
MKTELLITRLVLYGTLLVVILAALVAMRVLREPLPQLPPDELSSLRGSINAATGAMMASRNEALRSLGETGPGTPEAVSGPESASDAGSRFDRAFSDVEVSLHAQPGEINLAAAGGFIPPSMRVEDNLDAADSIFKADVADSTTYADAVARSSLDSQAPDYIRYLAYRELVRTLGRDIIKYENIDALPFHDLKETLYRTERDTKYGDWYLERSHGDAREEAGLSAINHRYYTYIQVLAGNLGEKWADRETEPVAGSGEIGVPADILSRMEGFAPIRIPGMSMVDVPPIPDLGRFAWLSEEAGLSDEFRAAGNGSE